MLCSLGAKQRNAMCEAFMADQYKQAVRCANGNKSRESTDGNDRGDRRSSKYRKGGDGTKYRSNKNRSDDASEFVSRKEFNALHKDLKKLLNNHQKDDHSESDDSDEQSP